MNCSRTHTDGERHDGDTTLVILPGPLAEPTPRFWEPDALDQVINHLIDEQRALAALHQCRLCSRYLEPGQPCGAYCARCSQAEAEASAKQERHRPRWIALGIVVALLVAIPWWAGAVAIIRWIGG